MFPLSQAYVSRLMESPQIAVQTEAPVNVLTTQLNPLSTAKQLFSLHPTFLPLSQT